jgi:hypothetical protein
MGSLNDISTARMVSISKAWLDPAREQPLLAALSSGKALLVIIQVAHEGLLATQEQDDPISREVSSISDKQTRIDRNHDRKIRAVYYLLNGFAEASDDPNQVAALIAARDELLPRGLSATKDSYLDEAGNVELAMKRVSPATKGLLKKLTVPNGNLWNLVEAWFAAGRELGTLEHQKDRLNASAATSSPGEALRARNAWIRVVRHVESTLELEGVSDDVAGAILHQVRLAEQDAERRVVADADDEAPKSL